ncbi:MAG: serine hydrolase [Gemmatimonadaceae bacterium]|nr:serine hydrolase [Gemmatimonadaceae bacterium]
MLVVSLGIAPIVQGHAQRQTGAAPLQRELARSFQRQLDSLALAAPGVVGIAVRDLTNGATFGVRDSLSFPTASAIKVALLVELYRQADAGTIALTDRVELRAADRAGGDGVAQYFAERGSALSLHDLAVLVSTQSDNTATNVLIDRLGMTRVSHTLDSLGLGELRLRRSMMRPAESARGNENVATPRAAAALMERLARCQLPMRQAACDDLRALLELPKRGTVSDVLPEGTAVAWKPGTLEGVSTAWALVRLRGRPYVMAAMVSYAGAGADEIVRRITGTTHAYFSRLASTTDYGVRVPIELLPDTDWLRAPRP